MYMSITAIESKSEEEAKTWLSFWCVFGIFQTLEMFFGFVFSFIPYYGLVRLIFFLYLMLPQTNGAYTLY